MRKSFAVRPWTRHSSILVVASVVYILVGVNYINVDVNPTNNRNFGAAVAVFPLYIWGFMFVVVGASSIFSVFWPPVRKNWGYIALTGISALWAGVYAVTYITLDGPLLTMSSSILWALMAFFWWAVSGLVDAREIRARVVS